jgi:hypothetical protein
MKISKYSRPGQLLEAEAPGKGGQRGRADRNPEPDDEPGARRAETAFAAAKPEFPHIRARTQIIFLSKIPNFPKVFEEKLRLEEFYLNHNSDKIRDLEVRFICSIRENR